MPEPKPRSILIVEDDEATARALRVLFHQRANCEVFWACSLTEAEVMVARLPSVVLLDLMLPDGPGEDFIQRVRDISPASEVVVVTALPEGSARVGRVAAMRPDAIFHKPYDVPTLIARIRSVPPASPAVPSPPSAAASGQPAAASQSVTIPAPLSITITTPEGPPP